MNGLGTPLAASACGPERGGEKKGQGERKKERWREEGERKRSKKRKVEKEGGLEGYNYKNGTIMTNKACGLRSERD